MTNEQIADELQGINGLLMGVEGYIRKYNEGFFTIRHLQDARSRIVALARQFEPPLSIEPPSGVPEKDLPTPADIRGILRQEFPHA